MKLKPSKPLVKQNRNQFVAKDNNKYYLLLKPKDIDRDSFFHLRTQLINIGCSKDEVVTVAKRLCMEALQIKDENEYLSYVLRCTYLKCKRNIKFGYDPFPIQDIQNLNYSHTNLFSSIYGFEIDYLKSKSICSKVADVGCGEGIFVRLSRNNNIESEGYDIKKPNYIHKVKVNLIEDFYDIKIPFQCLVLNHVLEHVQLRPDYYLKLVINHFEENFKDSILRVIFVSLPMHLHIPSHIASNHYWVCSDESFIEIETKDLIFKNGLKLFNPLKYFRDIAKKHNYNLLANNQIGIYVFEKDGY